MWKVMTYPSLDFDWYTVEVWEWIKLFDPIFYSIHVYLSMLAKGSKETEIKYLEIKQLRLSWRGKTYEYEAPVWFTSAI